MTAIESPTISGWVEETAGNRDDNPLQAYWAFWRFRHRAMADYPNLTLAINGSFLSLEAHAEDLQAPVEEMALRNYKNSASLSREILENYSRGFYQKARDTLAKDLKELPSRN